MSIITKDYEISIWKDKQYFVLQNGDLYTINTTIPSGYTVVNEFIKEIKLGVIGSNTLTAPIRAFEPKLTINVNGSNTFTFNIFYKYWDENSNTLKDNPWVSLLSNEVKIKLNYNNKIYDFIIKNIKEDSSKYSFTYECTDLFIEELSKNGYDLEFDTELNNNCGTITELAETILDESDWQIGSDSEIIQELTPEALFIYDVPQGTVLPGISMETKQGINIIGPTTIYILYSCLANEETKTQFLYRLDGKYTVDSNHIITNSEHYEINRSALGNPTVDTCGVSENYRGEKLIRSELGEYVSVIDQYCNIYIDDQTPQNEYYGYLDYIYTTGENLSQLITNNTDFCSADGWYAATNGSISSYRYSLTGSDYKNTLLINYGLDSETSYGYFGNTGIYNLRAKFSNGVNPEEKYIMLTDFYLDGSTSGKPVYAEIQGSYTDESTVTYSMRLDYDASYNQTIDGRLYYAYVGSFNKSVSAAHVMSSDILNFKIYGNAYAKLYLLDCKLFPIVYDGNDNLIIPDIQKVYNSIVQKVYKFFKKTELDNAVTSDDIQYTAIRYGSINTSDPSDIVFTVETSDNYEKVTSITASKSNRFNLLQDLAEAFKCWVAFNINHDNIGRVSYQYIKTQDVYYVAGKRYYTLREEIGSEIIDYYYSYLTDTIKNTFFTRCTSSSVFSNSTYYYTLLNSEYYYTLINKEEFEANKTDYYSFNKELWDNLYYEKTYNKFVSFHAYIGQDNYAGFKYGINLSSINRTLNSDNIVTKLIVEPNNNEYADSGEGFCSIQTASLNSQKENFLFNFDYYINQKILDSSVLHRDLYDNSNTNGLGYLIKIAKLNSNLNTYVIEQSQLVVTLVKAKANLSTASTTYNEALELEEQYKNYLIDAGYSATVVYSEDYPDSIKDYITKRDLYTQKKTTAEADKTFYTSEVTKYTKQYNTITTKLSNISLQKTGLNKEFYSKYSRYIREGSWIDEDYIDANKYYLDAVNVLYNSAFPQVDYKINVFELSAIEGYENYVFNIGDETYIEDTEFFGWDSTTGKPYQEKVVVTEIVYSLDDPSKNSITIKNYENRWESLFQRITASTESLQYHEGEYAKSSETVDDSGNIKGEYLEKAFAQNQLLADAISNELNSNGEAITLKNSSNLGKEIRIGSNGIVLKKNDEDGWTTAISADGINANEINTGRLNTNNIRIYGGNEATFEWNDDALIAYGHDGTIVSANKYVKFDQDGIIGVINNNTANPVFSLSYGGFELNSSFTYNSISYTYFTEHPTEPYYYLYSLEDRSIYRNYVEGLYPSDITTLYIKDGNTYTPISVSEFTYGENYYYYNSNKNEYVKYKAYYHPSLITQLYSITNTQNFLHMSTTDTLHTIQEILNLGFSNSQIVSPMRRIFWSGNGVDSSALTSNKFIVFEDGSLYANNGVFAGLLRADKIQMKSSNGSSWEDIVTKSGNVISLRGITLNGDAPSITIQPTKYDGTTIGSSLTITNNALSFKKDNSNYLQLTASSLILQSGNAKITMSNGNIYLEGGYISLGNALDGYATTSQVGTMIDAKFVSSPEFRATGSSMVIKMSSDGIVFGNVDNPCAKWGYSLGTGKKTDDSGWHYPYLQLGSGIDSDGTYKLEIKKFSSSYWFGSYAGVETTGPYPGGGTTRPTLLNSKYTGILIDLADSDQAIYQVIAGVVTPISTAVFG